MAIPGERGVTWSDWYALAAACEEHGVPALYSSDHYGSLPAAGRPVLDVWGVMCALAAVTTTLRLGVVVSPASLRHPSVLAKLAVTADQISGGRVDLGMGAGWHEEEHLAFGLRFPDLATRLDILDEQAEIVRGLLGPRPFSFAGSHYVYAAADAWPKPINLRVIIGGAAGPRSAGLAARWADEYNTGGVGPPECRRRREQLDAACEAAGRDPHSLHLSFETWLLLGRDEVELRDRARAAAAAEGDPTRAPADVLRKARGSDYWIVGTPADAAERLAGLADAGVERFLLLLPSPSDVDQVGLIARELAPLVRT